WGHVSDWCDYSGPVGDKTAGVAILAAPTNPIKSAWHSRGYGLMAANPFGREKSGFPAMKGNTDLVRIAKGEHLKLRYAGVVDDAGQPLAHVSLPTEAHRGQEFGLGRMCETIREAVRAAQVSTEQIAAIGVATPGTMDIPNGIILDPPNLKPWQNVPVRRH